MSVFTPRKGAAELSPIVEQPLASHEIVEAQGRVTEFRKEDERTDAACEKSLRNLLHHPPPQAKPAVLPAQVDLAPLAFERPLIGLTPGASNQSPAPVLQY
jgi:hypothetical protein